MREDGALIEATLGGDPEAFGELVRKYQDRLYNMMVHMVVCREEAEDVVQDTFVQAFRKLSSFKGNSAFYTWLYRIAFNLSISRRRKKKPGASLDQRRDDQGLEPVDASESQAARLEREERSGQIHAALAELSEEHRAILVLREMEDCDYETIAEMLDLPIGTVRSRLHRARSQLRESLRHVLQ